MNSVTQALVCESAGAMRAIALGNAPGIFAVIDEVDALLVGDGWSLGGGEGGKRYVHRNVGGRTTYLHRLIAGAAAGQYVDHRNGDTLNNRRHNLRICSQSQNLANMRPRPGHYKGVAARRGGWLARVSLKSGEVRAGVYDTAEEAAAAYDHLLVALFGEFARTNFPELRPHPLTRREKLAASSRCRKCNEPSEVSPIGRPRLFCSSRCADAARRLG